MEEAKAALLAEAEATVARLRGCRDECQTGGQVRVIMCLPACCYCGVT